MGEKIGAQISTSSGRSRIFAMVTMEKSREYTRHALRSFFATTPLRENDRFVLINNDDPNAEELRAPFSRVEHCVRETPHGFAANVNSMIEEALLSQADLFFLNNDIIFSEGWLLPLLESERSVCAPISNREVQYVGSVVLPKTEVVQQMFVFDGPMTLEQYLEAPRMFEAIADAHRRSSTGKMRLTVFPFYCVKLPFLVLQQIGKFDESYGVAGGEDYDYCLRAWLAGFDVHMTLETILLHFWGKSTWSSHEGKSASYNKEFLQIFRDKWGEALYRYVLCEDDSLLRANAKAEELRQQGDLKGMIEQVMRPGVSLRID
mgnify:CR=1 FL=1